MAKVGVRSAKRLRLQFSGKVAGKVTRNLSAVAVIDGTLWLAGDETASLECLAATPKGGFSQRASWELEDFLTLPGGKQEADLEGLSWDEGTGRLWFCGSHSLRRGRTKPGMDGKQGFKTLGKLDRQANRFLLGSVEIRQGSKGSLPCPVAGSGQAVPFGKAASSLIELLRQSERLAPFLDLPSKDNGFDVEGLAVADSQVLLGLRGPVLGGWASILHFDLLPDRLGWLKPQAIGRKGQPFQHYMLDLGGLGIRDLCLRGGELLILAGPTMLLDGPMRLFAWRLPFAKVQSRCVDRSEMRLVMEIPWGQSADHAEGIALLPSAEGDDRLLVVYDSPDESRLRGEVVYIADVFAF